MQYGDYQTAGTPEDASCAHLKHPKALGQPAGPSSRRHRINVGAGWVCDHSLTRLDRL